MCNESYVIIIYSILNFVKTFYSNYIYITFVPYKIIKLCLNIINFTIKFMIWTFVIIIKIYCA